MNQGVYHMLTYRTRGTCSAAIRVELDGDTVKYVEFVGGCSGNTQGVAKLTMGMNVHEAISRLKGICCGPKSTSCPDQLAQILDAVKP
jgi:uncharacterized protein (TIGR03905 family)